MNNFFLKQTYIEAFLNDEKLLLQFCLQGNVRFATALNWFKTNHEQLTLIKHLIIIRDILNVDAIENLVEEK